jgi:hypothetical protein
MATTVFRDDASIASRYLADQLSESERETYESALLGDPALVRELEATARLKAGLHHLRDSGELASLLREPRTFSTQFFLATAAALAAMIIGISLWRSDLTTSQPSLMTATLRSLVDRSGRALPVASTQAMFHKRADTYDAVIDLPPSDAAIELRVLPGTEAPAAHYRVSLSRLKDDGSLEPLASVAGLRPAADGFVTLYADASKLTPGQYRLVISSDSAGATGATADEFLIKVVHGTSR